MKAVKAMKAMSGRKVRGFTLIELLVIVTIIGVILVTTIPSISRWLPRYRLDRVAENFVQTCRVARLGAVQLHCNHSIRFYDANKIMLPMGSNPAPASYWEVFVDRNNNQRANAPSNTAEPRDKIIPGPRVYRDVALKLNPTGPNRQPYTAAWWDVSLFPTAASQLVFRPDGRVYIEETPGVFRQLSQCAILIESNVLTGTADNSPKATYKYRWVEIDAQGAIRLVASRQSGQ